MKTVPIILARMLVLLAYIPPGSGCRGPRVCDPTQQADYVMQFATLQVPESFHVFDRLARAQGAFVDGKPVTDLIIDGVIRSRKTRVTEFPLVYINSGQSRTVDHQTPGTYADGWDSAGNPTNFYVRGVGKKIDVSVFQVTNREVRTTLCVEDVAQPAWEKRTGFKHTVRVPYFPVMRCPVKDLRFSLDSWVVWPVGGSGEKNGRRSNGLLVLQVQETQAPADP